MQQCIVQYIEQHHMPNQYLNMYRVGEGCLTGTDYWMYWMYCTICVCTLSVHDVLYNIRGCIWCASSSAF